ncbi:MAG: hypothetical protein NUV49_02520 [Patescibacteria group bacterium]|nr:hypothetical protein [Patescibacteria group bacterium]
MPLNEPKQSFIPKKPLTPKSGRDGNSRGIVFSIAVLIFILSLLGSGGVYAYGQLIEKRITDKSAWLEQARGAFEPSLITEMERLDTRINVANEILAKHVAFSEFFKILEELTLQNVRFSRFDYSFIEGKPEIMLEGEARSYSSVALQSDIFGDNKYLKNPIFSNLGLAKEGNVTFNLELNLDPSVMLYKESIKQ